MGQAWRPTEAESAALSSALWNLGSTKAKFWHDDMEQCALIDLWLSSKKRDRSDKSDAYTVARRAALGELRAVTKWRRKPWSWEPEPDVHHDTPQALLEAFEAAQLLGRTSRRFKRAVAQLQG